MATVSMPSSFATRATTGAAPVPVPPPIPAVMNTIFVLSFSNRLMSSSLLSASLLPTSGLAPAPKPSPSCSFTGTGELASTFESVLQTANDTPSIPSLYMFLTALHPPPPTPTTLRILSDLSSTGPKSIVGIFKLSSIFPFFLFRLQSYNIYFKPQNFRKACERKNQRVRVT